MIKISANAASGVVDPPGEAFVMQKWIAGALIKESGGDAGEIAVKYEK